jgi:hypothetical protein
MLGEAQCEIPIGNPMRDAWEAYKKTEQYAADRKWAANDLHVDGSLWAAFVKGWQARDVIRSTPSTAAVGFASTGQGTSND